MEAPKRNFQAAGPRSTGGELEVDGFGVVVGGRGGMLASLGGSASASLGGLESVQGCGACNDLGRESNREGNIRLKS